MNETIAINKSTFARLLDAALYPNPDDPGDPGNPWGPHGPIGPVIRRLLQDWSWVMLNPQPLPPDPPPELWRMFASVMLNPQPLPPRRGSAAVRSAFMARLVIDQAVARSRALESMTGAETSDRTMENVRSFIREFVDDYCGTRPPRWPLPWPSPLTSEPAQLGPMDLLVAGAQFQKAADAAPNSPLQADFSAAADQLFKTGLKRAESM